MTRATRSCAFCRAAFATRRAAQKYCSHLCAQRHVQGSKAPRFTENIIPEPNSGCWIWIGHLYGTGYGSISEHGRQRAAHRYSYERHVGPIPDGLHVLHKCDVRACVNPEHLYLGTSRENARDRVERGSHARGQASSRAKLADQQIVAIRSMEAPHSAIARMFGVSRQQVTKIKARKAWAHVP